LKKVILAVILLVLICCGVVLASGDYDFRNVNWGMTMQEVLKVEKGKPINYDEQKGLIKYNVTVNEKDGTLYYHFDNNTGLLYDGKYSFENFKSADRYNSYAKYFLDILSFKYGNPVDQSPGSAIHNLYWKTGNTTIVYEFDDEEKFVNRFPTINHYIWLTYRDTNYYNKQHGDL
jgi:hypothetical protein